MNKNPEAGSFVFQNPDVYLSLKYLLDLRKFVASPIPEKEAGTAEDYERWHQHHDEFQEIKERYLEYEKSRGFYERAREQVLQATIRLTKKYDEAGWFG